MKQPKLCKDCKHVRKIGRYYDLRCFHPEVIKRDSWALSKETDIGGCAGSDCSEERSYRWPFGFCGMRGAAFEKV